jgi:hypothetical protein
MKDKGLETVSQVIGGLVGMMGNQLPAVDFADLKTMFERNSDGTPKVWYVGQGLASGEERAVEAAKAGAVDLRHQADTDGLEGA